MTSDIPTGAENTAEQANDAAGTAPRKPARRRATRPAAAPVAPPSAPSSAPAGLTDIVLPERATAPAEPAAPAAGAGTRSLADIVLPEGPGDAGGEPQKPARARRRATRAASTPSPEPAAEPTAPAEGEAELRRTEPKSTATTSTEPKSTRSRSGRAKAATSEAAASGDTTSEDAPAPKAEAAEETPKAKRAPRTRAAKTKAPAAEATESTTEPSTTQSSSTEAPTEAAATTDAPPKARRSTSKTTAAKTGKKTASAKKEAAAPAGTAAQDAPAQDATAAAPAKGSAASEATASTAARAGGTSTPRLATTALLFQAPDLSTSRRSRRAQAPAGPPRPHDEPTWGAPAPAAPSEPEAEAAQPTEQPQQAEPATEQPAEQKSSGRPARKRATRRSGSPAPEAADAGVEAPPAEKPAPAAEQPAPAVEPEAPAAPTELSEDDAAAVQEIGAIESELVAEGLELVDLGPEDLVDDDGDEDDIRPRRRRRRGGRGRRGGRRDDDGSPADDETDGEHDDDTEQDGTDGRADQGRADRDGSGRDADAAAEDDEDASTDGTEGGDSSSGRRRRRRRRGTRAERAERAEATTRGRGSDEVTALKGSTRLEAKRQRRREGRDAGRRRQIITEAEFLARRESVSRSMVVREQDGRTQIAVLEDGVLTEHYVSQQSQASMVGNVYLGRVQNVLPSMEAAFVDVGKGRNAVLYAGEVNWDAAGIEGQPRRIEEALKSGDSVLVQVTKDPIGHKGARLTSQVTLAGRFLVFVPGGGMTGISRKLPDTERSRLKKILREVVPDGAGVIVRTAAEGASEDELRADVERLQAQWSAITAKAEKSSTSAPALLQGEPDMAIRVVRDIFNDDFSSLVVQGTSAWDEISTYVSELAPDLRERVSKWTETTDVFTVHRVDEQLAKGMDRKVWLPSGGSLVIDRTEAMTVIDVNTGKFTGAGGTLEETVTRNNLEAAEEIVRQLRLRDIGGIIVIDFIDMVLESNRDLVLRRLVECLGRDRTKHQVAEVTSLGLVQMTRKRVGQGLVEAFSTTCEHCKGRGFIVHDHPLEKGGSGPQPAAEEAGDGGAKRSRRKRSGTKQADAPAAESHADVPKLPDDKSEAREAVKATLATIAAAAAHAHDHKDEDAAPSDDGAASAPTQPTKPELVIDLPERAKPEPEPVDQHPEPVEQEPEATGAAPKAAGTEEVPEQGAGEAPDEGLTATE
ncbi:Rne/Rng family ribonuclease [Isoptericola cucumis]|uniref:S1 motif domain-containing protein n=1 Tax=Isoptericola cucumis TaxID=1776856 RepID=A0ABQ2B2E2_9MICO|nr:Rne/Rng family ribonuclease [Isoptericola cucumis]GGI06241.1 hypothetical protein GCM10007368_10180 [Isoptericola cucumis]